MTDTLPQETPAPSEVPAAPVEVAPATLPAAIWLSKRPTVTFKIYVYRRPDEEELSAVMVLPLGEDAVKAAGVQEIAVEVEFSIPNRKQMARYKDRSARWVDEISSLVSDRNVIRQQIIRTHLLKMGIPHPTTGEALDFSRDEDGRLKPETETLLDELHPSLLDAIMTKFERDANLVY